MVELCCRTAHSATSGTKAVTWLTPSIGELTVTQVCPFSTGTSSMLVSVPRLSITLCIDVLPIA